MDVELSDARRSGFGMARSFAGLGIEKIVRDPGIHRILAGANEIMRRIVARALLGERAR